MCYPTLFFSPPPLHREGGGSKYAPEGFFIFFFSSLSLCFFFGFYGYERSLGTNLWMLEWLEYVVAYFCFLIIHQKQNNNTVQTFIFFYFLLLIEKLQPQPTTFWWKTKKTKPQMESNDKTPHHRHIHSTHTHIVVTWFSSSLSLSFYSCFWS